eukprot:5866995-Pleurochrysis_carterae.AAC.2
MQRRVTKQGLASSRAGEVTEIYDGHSKHVATAFPAQAVQPWRHTAGAAALASAAQPQPQSQPQPQPQQPLPDRALKEGVLAAA